MKNQNYDHLIGQPITVDYSTGIVQAIEYKQDRAIFTALFDDVIAKVEYIYSTKRFFWEV